MVPYLVGPEQGIITCNGANRFLNYCIFLVTLYLRRQVQDKMHVKIYLRVACDTRRYHLFYVTFLITYDKPTPLQEILYSIRLHKHSFLAFPPQKTKHII